MKKQSRFTILLGHLKEHSSLYLFIVVLFFMGVIFGAIVVNSMNFSQKQDLFVYLSRFFGQVEEGQFANSKDIFSQSYFLNIKYVLLMWVLGISIIGLPVILILLFLKGVVVGFTVGFLVNQLSWKGFLLSFVAILPQNMIAIPAYIIIGTLSVAFSLKMIRQQFVKRIQEPFFQQFIKYSMAMGLICLLLVAASLIEAMLSPIFMKSVISILD
ncbi:stage II sporulation protein M [Sutcliffiella horikoshii]|uniref:stage II sporulation protein M n=1 Tax=Sutcliffiella horikoshii TaxID=79883 RepID=UPI00203C81D5|nr:stage II sporulation protein M [Sutcliffiella horikoshii]MCM3617456.1 stage II sporulation protein M [Sutcliffiella horikoshii]